MREKKVFPSSGIPIRKSSDFLPEIFQTEGNKKFLTGAFDPLTQPGVLDKITGYLGRRYGKTYSGNDIYLDTNETLRSRYQLEAGVTVEKDQKIEKFHDYLDLKNIVKFFGNDVERDDKTFSQENYSWNPPIDWDKFANYTEYFWVPNGPPSVDVRGQAQTVVSTYKVRQGVGSSWIFTPDGATNNPTITLYRGQTYNFDVYSSEGFVIRLNYDTGSLIFDPNKTYFLGDLVVFDGQLWRAAVAEISPIDGSSIDINSQDWELVDSNAALSSLNFNNGVTNNGVKRGTLTFTVPMDAPDIIFYQSLVDANRLGTFLIADIDSNTFLDVEKEIIGKKTYTSANGVEFTNGLVVDFRGVIAPNQYADFTWLVEGVGQEITLTRFDSLVPPSVVSNVPEILFDNEGFDTQPFDDASQYAGSKDYITVSRNSKDFNPWSRYNRWFHRSVLDYSYSFRNSDFEAEESSRAKRPIIEFKPNLRLYNHGIVAKATVDYIDTFTTDVFSNIEGSTGYNVDGEFLFEGARVLVVSDTDSLANNKIYEVNFITHNNNKQITLKQTSDSDSIIGQGVLVRRGKNNAGKMYHFDGTNWVKSQEKTAVNQNPLFDLVDNNLISFGNKDTYPVSTFTGSPLLSYKVGNGRTDTELGFQLSYLNIDNVGDIEFNWNLDSDTFQYTQGQNTITVNLNTGFYNIDDRYDNGWLKTSNNYIMPIIDSYTVINTTNEVVFETVDWGSFTGNEKIIFYTNGKKENSTYERISNRFIFNKTFNPKDVVVIKVICDLEPINGYYELPVGLEKNPLNEPIKSFTLGQAVDHVSTGLEFYDEFTGQIPGSSNLRDQHDYYQHSKRFLKHSGLAPASVFLLNDKKFNIIKAIKFAKESYSTFKNNFILKAEEVDFNDNVADMVDKIITELSKAKSIDSPFADSDMIGAGAYSALTYEVEDTGIKTFALSQSFDLNTLSRRAVYPYVNNRQLLYGAEYDFNSDFGFIEIKIDLVEGDKIEIREYTSTSFSHIPPTPTALGLYKRYTPMKFLDDTYREPVNVIQGHDGSIITAYNDYRDDLILELEYRIYNNIKKVYSESVFDIDNTLGGFYGNSEYNINNIRDIINQEFLNWVSNTNLGYVLNTFFVNNEPFTYTYNQMASPDGTENLPGYWRGVYRYFYDTDRPHRCPWECLGFSEKPEWWEDEYGSAPYTSGNLILWEDIRDGIIRHGPREGIHPRYARTSIMSHIPVNEDGELLDPLTSGLATNFTLTNNKGSFQLGDVGPVEYAWKSSSEYPFAVIVSLCLVKPFDFIISNFDKDKTTRNIIDQIVDKTSNVFLTTNNLKLPIAGENQVSGLAYYISSYIKGQGASVVDANESLENLNVRLTARLSGFVDKDQQKFLLDSKNPNSTSSSTFIPPENYDIIFAKSSPITSLAYSGVIIEKSSNGWTLSGYNDINPYFEYYQAIPNQKDPTISVGGLSVAFTQWEENKTYNNGAVVEFRNTFFRANQTHTSTTEFENQYWSRLPALPVEGAATAQRRRNFNRTVIKRLSYGTEYSEAQAVVDFLLGYQERLVSQGFVFNNYDTRSQVIQDWLTSSKEFLFWTMQNWSEGSLLTVSPGAQKLTVVVPVGVADSILDSFYDYNVLSSDGTTIDVKDIDVSRDFQTFTISINNSAVGIYYLKVNYVLKEHVTVFNDRTVFNDIIYDKPTGYRQERIRSQGFRTVDWDGDYTSPGFIFDNVNIDAWVPFKNYKLGDIVAYRSKNYTSKFNHTSGEKFDFDRWTVLDSNPTKQLIPNFDYRINQIEDYFDVDTDGLGKSQRELARHTIGYQKRTYLEALADDPTTQYKIYQGFIREKGTSNSITKLFDKINGSGQPSISLDEEWAFKVGSMGGIDQSYHAEIKLQTDQFVINPQPVLITESQGNFLDRFYRINKSNFDYAPYPYTSKINPASYEVYPFKTAGYVKIGQTNFTVKTRDNLSDINVDAVLNNDHIWITFDGPSWTVLRANWAYDLQLINVEVDNLSVKVIFKRRHNKQVGEFIGIKGIDKISGIHKITAVDNFSITFNVTEKATADVFEPSTLNYPLFFTEARFKNWDSIDPQHVANLSQSSKLFVDEDTNGRWEVVEKNKTYTDKQIVNFGIVEPNKVGEKVLYIDALKQTLASVAPDGYVVVYVETSTGLDVKQIIEPQGTFKDSTLGSFGLELAVSPDNKWLAIGSPRASGVTSNFKGNFNPSISYGSNSIVLYEGKLWKALTDTTFDGSSINFESDEWEYVKNIDALTTGTDDGKTQQGMIQIYEYSANQWNITHSYISPRPEHYEHFGSRISIAKNEGVYYMAVSAPGSLDSKGRIYLYTYNAETEDWELDENPNYVGAYEKDESKLYPKGSIVWHQGYLWQAVNDTQGDGSTIDIDSVDWLRLDSLATANSLPQSVSLEEAEDKSTLFAGLLSPLQVAELIQEGDKFGYSMAMNSTGEVLVVGAPFSDKQYFANYRGIWRADYEYIEGDVVKYQGQFHKLENIGPSAVDDGSTIKSYNEEPDAGYPWVNVGDSSSESTGKVFVYKRDFNLNLFELTQTFTADGLQDISDLDVAEIISSGDQFGYAVAVDSTGEKIVVTSPKADVNFQNQGSAYIFDYVPDSSNEYRLKQKLDSFDTFPNEFFGQDVAISVHTDILAIGANNTPYVLPTIFDGEETTFDQKITKFKSYSGFSGSVYIYELKGGNKYYLSEKLESNLSLNESFGYSISCTGNVVVVGSPYYIAPVQSGSSIVFEGDATGMVRIFKKDPTVQPFEILSSQPETVDINQIKRIALYDDNSDDKIQDLEIVDPAKMKILASAEKELSYKTPYDPAVYSIGDPEVQVVDEQIPWTTKNVGKLWWDIGNAKWIDYEQGDIAYRTSNWGQLATGSSIDIYEWVESTLTPAEWSAVADTNEGLNASISGQPLYPNNEAYSVKELLNPETGEATSTLYYFWVKNKLIAPKNIVGRSISASSVASLISNPLSGGVTYIALADADKFVLFNYTNIVSNDYAILNIEYYNNKDSKNAVHNEFTLLTENVEDSIPTDSLERKWLDSLIGYDLQGNRIPDTDLPAKQRYGIKFRPRQSMFVNKQTILKTVIKNINTVLLKEAFADVITYKNLNLVDEQPSEVLNLFDVAVETYIDLETVGTIRVKQAEISANIVDGEILSIDVIEPGFGYRTAPSIDFEGDGQGLEAQTVIDSQGRVTRVDVLNGGKLYSSVIAKVRQFSVLVRNDETSNGFWSIYAWDDIRKVFFRSASQAYDTRLYWDKVNWWAEGYDPTIRIVEEIPSVYQEPALDIVIGDTIRIKEYGAGGWAVFKKVDDVGNTLLENYILVGRENGTIQFSDKLYDTDTSGIGYDIVDSFDAGSYDKEVSNELRNIFRAVKEDIFVGDYKIEWNKLFFVSMKYVFTEQTYVDWAFKTSFLSASYKIGELKQKLNYKNDSLDSYLDYINEVKPFRTTIREYKSIYDKLETSNTAISDFDLPPYFNEVEGKIIPLTQTDDNLQNYPYKFWADTKGYEITEILVSNPGSGYTSVPTVVIQGNGTGASARAYISNGKLSAVSIENPGSGYTTIPTVSIVGGNGSNTDNATAVAVLGNTTARAFDLKVKFDRISKDGIFNTFNFTQTFTAPGNTASFDLSYPSTLDKSKIQIIKNGQLVLGDEYSVSLYKKIENRVTQLKAKILFTTAPELGETIVVTYDKNDELLDSVNRIKKYYDPIAGMKGTDLDQLMTGIDYGGVQVQGTTFDVTGGWDALPWFTDSWDSVEAAADYYVICDGSTNTVTLPYVPAQGQEINIYLKRFVEVQIPTVDDLQYSQEVKDPPALRIDDPSYDENWDSSNVANPHAQMPTFIGDGSTQIVEIGDYIQTGAGDILIFRPVSSDGSVTITDPNLVDTRISGGTLATNNGAYSTATGKTVEEITILGGEFISPENVPATEENIPGQVLDSLSIKVYTTTGTGSAPVKTRVINTDGTTTTFDIGQNILESKSVVIYLGGAKVSTSDYFVNLENNQVIFDTAPTADQVLEIISVGVGGVSILDYQEFEADGETNLFLTNASFAQTTGVFVSVNGVLEDIGFIDSTGVADTPNRTLVQFGITPARLSTIKILCVGSGSDVDSSGLPIISINQQEIAYDGSSRSYDLTGFVNLVRDSSVASMIVEVNNRKLKGVDTTYAVYDGTNNAFTLGLDPEEVSGAILTNNIRVFVNGDRKTFIEDYIYNGTTKILEFNTGVLSLGDKIKIENDLRTTYTVDNNNIVIDSSVTLNPGDIINVTWFSEYPSMSIISDRYTGGKVVYQLPTNPLGVSYVWAYLNGTRLVQDVDYVVDLPRGVMRLFVANTDSDEVEIVMFGTNVFKLPSAYEIHKDMLNVYRYHRYASKDEVRLSKDLNYFDTEIEVTNGHLLATPIVERNLAGVVIINNEKIEYLEKTGNILKKLRRGALGTAIKELHSSGDIVIDAGAPEAIAYNDTQERTDFVSDGSSVLIGPLEFVPIQASDSNWYAETIPQDYGRCDTIEVFAGGKRLRKNSLEVFDESLGVSSPGADKKLEAEFSVDGTTPYIRLTSPLPAGTRIRIIRKLGKTWYDRGVTTATSGVTLLDNDSAISKFIAAKTTRLPE